MVGERAAKKLVACAALLVRENSPVWGQERKVMSMKKWAFPMSCVVGVFFLSIVYATSPSPDDPPTATVESLVKGYVDKDFIHEELPPPAQCEKYSEKLMFAYDWNVVIHKIGLYDPALKLLPVEATVIVRCGPLQPLPRSPGEGDASDFPLRSETPINFQMMLDSQQPQQWKVHNVTLWKSKQKVIEQ
jgi:hypothetical protein